MTGLIIRRLARLAAMSAALPLMALCVFAQQPAATPASAPALPKVVMPFTSYSFDDVYRGEVVSQIFNIKNAGTADLVIKDFTVSCSCEVVDWDRIIPPGKEG